MPDPAPSLTMQAAGLLREGILWNRFEPGERLKLDRLQSAFGLSSTPLREALSRLASEGLVESDDRRGFKVADVSAAELRDITRVRLLLERETLADAMRNGDDEWEARVLAALHRLGAVEKRMPSIAPSLDPEWSARHREFHAALVSACESKNLLRLWDDYFSRAERYRRISAQFRASPRNKAREHERIARAVLARDAAAALASMEKHISATAKNVHDYLDARRP